jgi:TetR/AcrR family transcriptional regulator, transcriptional repressor for nem operon
MSGTATQILNAAEALMRDSGYHAFSFREIATELSIKSASVHYHFPTKEALGNAVTKRYTDNFLAVLGEPQAHPDPIDYYISAFRQSLEADGRACLCGILASESGRLPESMRNTLKDFNLKNLAWLERALSSQQDWTNKRRREMAHIIFSAMEGAMIFASLNQEADHMIRVGDSLKTLLTA